MVKRGEVWVCALDPTVGSEIRKMRPCVIVSPDELNDRLRTAIVAPMTTGSRPAPFRVALSFQGKTGLILLDQVRTVDVTRFAKRAGRIDAQTLLDVMGSLSSMFTR